MAIVMVNIEMHIALLMRLPGPNRPSVGPSGSADAECMRGFGIKGEIYGPANTR
jgi:hypothetical protein